MFMSWLKIAARRRRTTLRERSISRFKSAMAQRPDRVPDHSARQRLLQCRVFDKQGCRSDGLTFGMTPWMPGHESSVVKSQPGVVGRAGSSLGGPLEAL